MNKIQKFILVIYALGFIFLNVLYVPYTATWGRWDISYYSSLWSPRSHPMIKRTVDQGKYSPYEWSVKVNSLSLFMETISFSIVCGIAFILCSKQKNGKLD